MSILDKIKKVFSGETNSPAAANPDPNPKKSTEEYYIAGIQEERAMKDRFLRMDPQSPLPDRADFAGLAYFDPNPA
jgi:hypothetical protein